MVTSLELSSLIDVEYNLVIGTKLTMTYNDGSPQILVMDIPNNKEQVKKSYDKDNNLVLQQEDATYDNEIVNIKFTKFYKGVIDNIHTVMAAA